MVLNFKVIKFFPVSRLLDLFLRVRVMKGWAQQDEDTSFYFWFLSYLVNFYEFSLTVISWQLACQILDSKWEELWFETIFFFFFFFAFIYLCVEVGTRKGQRTTNRSWFFPSTMWVLALSAFTQSLGLIRIARCSKSQKVLTC